MLQLSFSRVKNANCRNAGRIELIPERKLKEFR